MMAEDRAARIVHRLLSPHSSWEQFERILVSQQRLGWNQAVAYVADQIRAAIEAELLAGKLLTGAIDPDYAKELDAERQAGEEKVWEWAA
jgi:hypothetical protein